MIIFLNTSNLTLQRRFGLETTLNESPLISDFIKSSKHGTHFPVKTIFARRQSKCKHSYK